MNQAPSREVKAALPRTALQGASRGLSVFIPGHNLLGICGKLTVAMPDIIRVSRKQALAFRLSGHNLTQRQPLDAMNDVAAACGVRNTPPGSAALGLLARLDDLTPEHVDEALEAKAGLVEVLSIRISPLLAPKRDVDVFSIGALPRSEASLESSLVNFKSALKEAGLTPAKALDLSVSAAHDALANGGLVRGELSAAITEQLPKPLRAWCPGCKVHHVPETLFRLIGVHGAFVITRQGKESIYERADKVLGRRKKLSATSARAELLRRYLHCFGPSTSADFAAWVGIAASEGKEDWEHFSDDLIEVDLDDRPVWIHKDDVDVLRDPPSAAGVRLLPPYDAYLDQRDRETLIPDKALHPRVWRAIGNPGVVVRGGEAVGTWRTQKKGKRLILTAEAFDEFSARARDDISKQAELLAPFRECAAVETVFQ